MNAVNKFCEDIAPHIATAKNTIRGIEANFFGVDCDKTGEQAKASLYFIHSQAKELKASLKAINAVCNRYGGRIANLCKEKQGGK